MAQQLIPGDLFPNYVVNTVDGTTLKVPEHFSGQYSILLFYRGYW